jgi:hypothetical protein
MRSVLRMAFPRHGNESERTRCAIRKSHIAMALYALTLPRASRLR